MNAIVKFQLQYGLDADGIVGRNTAKKIRDVYFLSDEQAAHFLGQLKVESDFKSVRENMNYSWVSLRRVFRKYFRTDRVAKLFHRKPKEIANRVYGGRMGNDRKNDGWLNRGAGFLQITGERNIHAFADYVGDPKIKDDPNLIATNYAFESSLWFFERNKIWLYCNVVNQRTITMVSKAINLGSPFSKYRPNHLSRRIKWTNYYYARLKS